MVDQLELAVADVVVDGLGHPDGDQVQPARLANSATLWAVSIESLPPM